LSWASPKWAPQERRYFAAPAVSTPDTITLAGKDGYIQIDHASRTLLRDKYRSGPEAPIGAGGQENFSLHDIVRVDISFDDSRYSAVSDIFHLIVSLIPGGLILGIVNYDTLTASSSNEFVPDMTNQLKIIVNAAGVVATLLMFVWSHRSLFRMFNRILRILFFCCLRNGSVAFGLRGGPYETETLSLRFLTCGDTGVSEQVADVVFDEVCRSGGQVPQAPLCAETGLPIRQSVDFVSQNRIRARWVGKDGGVMTLYEKSLSVVSPQSCLSSDSSSVRHDLLDIGLIRIGLHSHHGFVSIILFVGFVASIAFGTALLATGHGFAVFGCSGGFAFLLCALNCRCCGSPAMSMYSSSNTKLPPFTFVGAFGQETAPIVAAIRAQQMQLRRVHPQQQFYPSSSSLQNSISGSATAINWCESCVMSRADPTLFWTCERFFFKVPHVVFFLLLLSSLVLYGFVVVTLVSRIYATTKAFSPPLLLYSKPEYRKIKI
jgi:hypothetical protein